MDAQLKKAAENYRSAAEALILRAEILESAGGAISSALSTRHRHEAASMARFLEVWDVDNFLSDPGSVLAAMTEHVAVESSVLSTKADHVALGGR